MTKPLTLREVMQMTALSCSAVYAPMGRRREYARCAAGWRRRRNSTSRWRAARCSFRTRKLSA